MTFVILFILAVVWALYLAFWLRSRSEHRGVDSISSFNRHLSVLERTSPARHGITAVPHRTGRRVVGPDAYRMNLSEARRRRRDVLYALLGAAAVTLALAVAAGGLLVWVHLLVVVLLVGYVGLLVRARRLADERRAKVLHLGVTAARHDDHDLGPVGGYDVYPRREAYLLQSSAR